MSRAVIIILTLGAFALALMASCLLGMEIRRGSRGNGEITARFTLTLLCVAATIALAAAV